MVPSNCLRSASTCCFSSSTAFLTSESSSLRLRSGSALGILASSARTALGKRPHHHRRPIRDQKRKTLARQRAAGVLRRFAQSQGLAQIPIEFSLRRDERRQARVKVFVDELPQQRLVGADDLVQQFRWQRRQFAGGLFKMSCASTRTVMSSPVLESLTWTWCPSQISRKMPSSVRCWLRAAS